MAMDTAAVMAKLERIEARLAAIERGNRLTDKERRAIREANAAFDAGHTTRLA